MVHPKEKIEARKRLFATRFKTEMCRTFVTRGSCPYGTKCMFAHGEGELRTEAMNERDGLVSTKAVRRWLKGGQFPSQPSCTVCRDSLSAASTTQDESTNPSSQSRNSATRGVVMSITTRRTTWRHDPYSWVPFVTSSVSEMSPHDCSADVETLG